MASEYGWAKSEILDDTYLDEAWDYICLIRRRAISEYKMQIGIYHGKPEESIKLLDEEANKVEIKEKSALETETLDKTGFAALKSAMSNNPRIQIKG